MHQDQPHPDPNNFNAQIPVSPNLFRIALSNANGSMESTPSTTNTKPDGHSHLVVTEQQQRLVGRSATNLIINSVENFQIIPKSVQEMKISQSSSTQSSSGKKIPSQGDAAELDNAPLPTAERLSSVASRRNATTKSFVRPVPEGVVAVPPNEMILEERLPAAEAKTTPLSDQSGDQTNNRYSNVVDEVQAPGGEEEQPKAVASVADLPAVSEVDNGAREVMDNNEFLVDGHKDHLQAVLDDVKLGGNNNNAAEVDEDGVQRQRNMDDPNEQNDVDNAILSGVGVGNGGNENGDGLMAQQHRGGAHNNKLSKDPKLMREIDADDGKVAGYPDDMHMEENNEDEGDGDGEFGRFLKNT